MLDLSLEVVKVLRSPRYVNDVTIEVSEDGSHKRLIECEGIDGTIRDPIPGIWRNRSDAKEHAGGTRCIAELQQMEQGCLRGRQCHLRL